MPFFGGEVCVFHCQVCVCVCVCGLIDALKKKNFLFVSTTTHTHTHTKGGWKYSIGGSVDIGTFFEMRTQQGFFVFLGVLLVVKKKRICIELEYVVCLWNLWSLCCLHGLCVCVKQLGMWLKRHQEEGGVYQATQYSHKAMRTSGLKNGGYFVTPDVCEKFKTHHQGDSSRRKLRSRKGSLRGTPSLPVNEKDNEKEQDDAEEEEEEEDKQSIEIEEEEVVVPDQAEEEDETGMLFLFVMS